MIAEQRAAARRDPEAGLPELARRLTSFAFRVEPAADAVPYFEEAAALYRRLATDGDRTRVRAAMHAFSRLGQCCSRAHLDDRSLAARSEAASLARQAGGDGRILVALAHALAEAGRFAEAVDVQTEAVDGYRAAGSPHPAVLRWWLLDLAIHLELAGRTGDSLAVEEEILSSVRDMSDSDPVTAMWTAASSLRFADTGRPERARDLLAASIAVCDRLPAEGSTANYPFRQALQAALSGRAERPLLGLGLHHWSAGRRAAYRIDPSADSVVRASILCTGLPQFRDEILPALADRAASGRPRPLVLHALALLAVGANARAGTSLREALVRSPSAR